MSEAATPSPILWFPPELVVELALGAEHPHDLAERYGLDEVEYEHLASLPWFEEMVARKRVEFQDSGLMFQAKAAMMAEALLTRLFQQSMGGKLTPPIQIEVSKQLTEIGRLKPQPGVPGVGGANGGPGFQINIQVNGQAPQPLAPVASAAAPAASIVSSPVDNSGVMTIDMTPAAQPPQGASGLPPKPAYISNLTPPNFDRDAVVRRGIGLGAPVSSLTGTPQAQAAATSPSSMPPATPTSGVGLPPKSPLG